MVEETELLVLDPLEELAAFEPHQVPIDEPETPEDVFGSDEVPAHAPLGAHDHEVLGTLLAAAAVAESKSETKAVDLELAKKSAFEARIQARVDQMRAEWEQYKFVAVPEMDAMVLKDGTVVHHLFPMRRTHPPQGSAKADEHRRQLASLQLFLEDEAREQLARLAKS